jgi:hypothetical protein
VSRLRCVSKTEQPPRVLSSLAPLRVPSPAFFFFSSSSSSFVREIKSRRNGTDLCVCCGEAERSVLTLSEAEDAVVDGGARRTAMARPWRLMLPLLVLYSPIVYSQGDRPPLLALFPPARSIPARVASGAS